MSFRILIVDDEEPIRDLCAAILTNYGYECETAGCGFEGVNRFTSAEGAFDLVLSDVLMPDFSGPEMVRRMERTRADFRFLYMSGFPDATFPPSQRKTRVLQKPFTARQLIAEVEQILKA